MTIPDGLESAKPTSTGVLLRKTARGAGWIVGWRMVTRFLGLISTLVLARLLFPSDFGVVALGTALSGAIDALSSLGVEEALIREEVLNRDLYDTAFTLNLIRSGGTAAILIIAALPAARFFVDPRLTLVVLSLAACSFVAGLANIGPIDYRKSLDFRREFVLRVIPRLAGFVVTIIGAIAWRSYWALLAGIAATRVLGTLLSYLMHPYRPRLSLRRWRHLGSFSLWTWAIGVAFTVRDRAAAFLVARYLGEFDLGTYTVGLEIAVMPISEILGPLGRACFSSFAATRHDGSDPAEVYMRVLSVAAMAIFPVAIGISAVADPATRIFLGSHWLAAIPVIQILAVFIITTVFWLISEIMLSAYAKLGVMFRLSVVFAFVRLVSLAYAVPRFGLMGAVYATSLAASLEHLVWLGVTLRVFRISLRAILIRIWRPIVAAIGMSAMLMATKLGWWPVSGSSMRLAGALVTSSGTGAACYVGALVSLWFVSGRPTGAETDAFSLVSPLAAKVFGPTLRILWRR